MIAGARQLLLLRDGGCLREAVARRSRTAGGTRAERGSLTALIYLIHQQSESQSVPRLGLIQPRRSIKGSDTPHAQLNSGLRGAGKLRVVSVTNSQPNWLVLVVAFSDERIKTTGRPKGFHARSRPVAGLLGAHRAWPASRGGRICARGSVILPGRPTKPTISSVGTPDETPSRTTSSPKR